MDIDEWAELHGETRMTWQQFEIEERKAANEFDYFAKIREIWLLHDEYEQIVKKLNYAYAALSNGEIGPAMEVLDEIPERLGERQEDE